MSVSMNTSWIWSVSNRALRWTGALSVSSHILKGVYFSWVVCLKSGVRIFSKPCCQQMCCHPGFAIPCRECRWVDLAELLRTLRCHQPDRTVCSPKPCMHFSSLAMNILDGGIFQRRLCFIYTENLEFSVATFISYIAAASHIRTCGFTL